MIEARVVVLRIRGIHVDEVSTHVISKDWSALALLNEVFVVRTNRTIARTVRRRAHHSLNRCRSVEESRDDIDLSATSHRFDLGVLAKVTRLREVRGATCRHGSDVHESTEIVRLFFLGETLIFFIDGLDRCSNRIELYGLTHTEIAITVICGDKTERTAESFPTMGKDAAFREKRSCLAIKAGCLASLAVDRARLTQKLAIALNGGNPIGIPTCPARFIFVGLAPERFQVTRFFFQSRSVELFQRGTVLGEGGCKVLIPVKALEESRAVLSPMLGEALRDDLRKTL